MERLDVQFESAAVLACWPGRLDSEAFPFTRCIILACVVLVIGLKTTARGVSSAKENGCRLSLRRQAVERKQKGAQIACARTAS